MEIHDIQSVSAALRRPSEQECGRDGVAAVEMARAIAIRFRMEQEGGGKSVIVDASVPDDVDYARLRRDHFERERTRLGMFRLKNLEYVMRREEGELRRTVECMDRMTEYEERLQLQKELQDRQRRELRMRLEEREIRREWVGSALSGAGVVVVGWRAARRALSSTIVPPGPSAVVRREVTKAERAANRAARKERANAFISGGGGMTGPAATTGTGGMAAEGNAASSGKSADVIAATTVGGNSSSSSSGGRPTFDATRLGWYAAVIMPTAFVGWGIMDEDSPPARLSRLIGLTGVLEEYAKPARTKLLPDWNMIPNIPPDFPAPPCLVIDLESTLVCSTWDRKYGWRHAKRPGVDKFLALMAQYYEVVIWTPSPDGLAGPVVDSLDSKGYVMHRLFRDSTNYHDGVHRKDLSWLNRPLNKIIALDDDPEALKFQPENLIRMKPYDDPNADDDTLERITPLLVEISREGYDDIPGLLRQFHGMDADEIAEEHERRVNDLRERRERLKRRGLGSLASTSGRNMPPPELPSNLSGGGGGDGGGVQQLTSKDLVGNAPPSESSESGVAGWLQRRQKLHEEQNREKFELWNEFMMKKQAEKKRRAEEQSH
ncbi:hypothetical protein ACHAXA_005753 [Cyclostephanos tholiformis]|uniref:FCP1 homology domain-containing protein n=1 Tax=Cyclostephanos tholiformis TaxID=382380 RepID=A0ABD3RSG1_9STRA